jgi:hypothetical protein
MNRLNGNTAGVTEEEGTTKRRSIYWKLEAMLRFEVVKNIVASAVVLWYNC